MDELEYRDELLNLEQVSVELKKHGHPDTCEFITDMGLRACYSGDEVLDWLGY